MSGSSDLGVLVEVVLEVVVGVGEFEFVPLLVEGLLNPALKKIGALSILVVCGLVVVGFGFVLRGSKSSCSVF